MAGGATIVNREIGSGSRMLLEQTLQKEQIPFDAVQGFDNILKTHQDVAQAVVRGVADAGMSTASVATAFGLGFIPLHQSRYDLVILKEYLEEAPVQQLLSTLGHRMVHSQFEILGGYDISKIGEVVAVTTCNTNRSNLQSRHLQTRIKCNYNCASARIKCNVPLDYLQPTCNHRFEPGLNAIS
ncbi:XRE family transcriptional regulator [Nostoc commune NIES-4072]|uniref:XRE family transcriptional regulator n=1 Tax=Nostoc commune NIES-4072 TaxID=2005467 RepID=A0A2R5FJB1_NOSCO|nr:XRE family transcriptional regulator [Nostoc commune HK-02]GBG18820.1 XRE family transcriptional regulator [Nostoc commune NIES-4072]